MSKLKVISKKNGFRRAGFTFSDQEPTIIDVSLLPKDSRTEIVEAIKAEPMLIVVELAEDGTETQISKDDDKALLKLQKQLEAANEEIKSLQATISAQQDANAKQSADIDNLEAQLTAANDELAALKSGAESTSASKKK